ncbi:MAG: hypothetical protein IKE65_06395 [Clostridia bacterium]|nr:hypothetical protein [Clostridia bacterium]
MKLLIHFSPQSGKQLLRELSHAGVPVVNKLFAFGNMLPLAEGAMLKLLQAYLRANMPEVQVSTLHLQKSDHEYYNALELEGSITDYPAFMERLLPMLKKAAQSEVRLQPICDVLEIINKRAPGMMKGNIATLGKDTMDDIIATLVMGYNEIICERINAKLRAKGLAITVKYIDVQK